ncbi:helix-turn-helix domain-containing protein [Seonamhaeicola aphaedonensis]|uniref:Helix-turn-helix protein n=1 Tax=Seonamhaeicola aphaedonensis TaxID=1461338 RepID=A0A3D9HH83_9FLAO|nr:helix-turn-helix domain-containing protein [Seonamhaeicola aphaedonensis]RED48823.1 helix-turn-helix protein [Seonamhaeicola aphaedonensis]
MITKTIQINEITFDELAEKVADKLLIKIEDYLKQLSESEADVYLTRHETAALFKVDISTIHNWRVKGKLKSYGFGNRIYYNKQELLDQLRANRLS